MSVGVEACPACGQTVDVITTDGGRRVRVDPGTHPDGTIILHTLPDGAVRGTVLDGARLPAQEPARRDHRATCARSPHAARRAHAARALCGACRTPMDPWLTANGHTRHIGCYPTPKGDTP